MEKEKKSLEDSFLEMNEIINKLEKEDITLEESFRLYQEGVKLLKSCHESIDHVEKQLIVLDEDQSEMK